MKWSRVFNVISRCAQINIIWEKIEEEDVYNYTASSNMKADILAKTIVQLM